MGVTSTGKPGGCKHVRTSDVLGGSPECAEHVLQVRESAASVWTLQEWYGKCKNVPECTEVLQDWECGGKWKALESSKKWDFRGQQDTGHINVILVLV